ncbi:MAG TPA: lysine-sensitive aspartokinase 3 [Gemmatimonadaceae bacterium]|nr:lysine-sensitive aspartokinase 3 [Gemmatimonadaceae bacterium]
MIVIKFGGTSVENAEAIVRAAEITRGRLARHPVVVVSALARATNELLAIAADAARGQLIGALRAVEALRERHLAEADALLGHDAAGDEVRAEMSAMFDELASLAEALSVLGHATARSHDAVAAYGELLSATLVHAAFRARGLPVELVDARDVMMTDDHFGRAAPQLDGITRQARAHLVPIVEAGRVPLLAGFIGRSPQGVTTTIGRGGGDYSAALVGAALGAEAIEIWTDVDGMLTADPRVVEDARLIERIRFDEAAELSAFGAKVLHPSTIAPAVQRGIPVFIFNSRRPEGTGTRITAEAPRRAVSAIAGKGGISVVRVNSSRMLLAHGFMRTLFEIFERHRISVDVVATSEVSVSVTVDDASHLDALLVDLRALGDVTIERQRAIVALVGSGLGGSSETMARALAALDGIRVHMISLSATEINLTIIVDADQRAPAMRALHREFFATGGTAR